VKKTESLPCSWLYLDAEVLVLPLVFLLQDSVFFAADLRRHPTFAHPCPVSSVVLVWPVPRGVSAILRAVSLRVSISQPHTLLPPPLYSLQLSVILK